MKTIYFLSIIIFLSSCSDDKSIYEIKFESDQVLINKETGQLWRKACLSEKNGNCNYVAWMKEDIDGINKSREEIWEISAAFRKMSSGHQVDEKNNDPFEGFELYPTKKESDPFADFNPNPQPKVKDPK